MVHIDYDFHIKSALEALSDGSFTFRDIIHELHDMIVDYYNGDVFSEYKKGWHQAVNDYAKKKEIEFNSKTKSNWECISSAIIDRLVAKGYNFQKPARNRGSVSSQSSAPRESCGSVRESSGSSSVIDTVSSSSDVSKQVKLTQDDKAKIKRMYAGLDKQKMWKLSTGTLVEEKMIEHGIKQDCEHLCHSLILNIQDTCWNNYFTAQEIQEIRGFNALDLPSLPSDAKEYIDELKAVPRSNLYDKVNEATHISSSDRKWIQDSYNACFRLVESGFFPLRDVTEQGIGKRMWSCIDTCFDFSSIRCVSGEKCSQASADVANLNRSSSDYSRQSPGRKMDYLFKTKDADIEVGCGECALVGGVNTTKEFNDAGFKMPKVLKDMMFRVISKYPALLHKLHFSGFYIGCKELTLWILDAPAGFVCRYDAFPSVEYPVTESMIRKQMSTLLKMIVAARTIMEHCKDIVDDDVCEPILDRYQSFAMEPCFIPVNVSSKKRKQ